MNCPAALFEGQTPEQVLALTGRRLKAARAALFEALQDDLSPTYGFMLSETLAHLKALEARIARFDELAPQPDLWTYSGSDSAPRA